MFILDSLLINGISFVLDKLATAADAESHDDTALREQLLEAQLRYEMGEITDAEFANVERDVLARIREIKGGPSHGALTMTDSNARITGVEATVADELNELSDHTELLTAPAPARRSAPRRTTGRTRRAPRRS
jgi:hypothetical protein